MNSDKQQPSNGDRIERIERALDQLVGVVASHDARLDQLVSVVASHEVRLDQLVTVQHRHERDIDGLMEIIQRHSQETVERFRETDAKLNALVKVVDDLVRKRPPQPPAD